jgi:hypothetical protein
MDPLQFHVHQTSPYGSSYLVFFFQPRSRTSCFLRQNHLPLSTLRAQCRCEPLRGQALPAPWPWTPCVLCTDELSSMYGDPRPLQHQPLGRSSSRSPRRVCTGEARSSYPFISLLSIPSMLCVSTRRGLPMASERPWQPARQPPAQRPRSLYASASCRTSSTRLVIVQPSSREPRLGIVVMPDAAQLRLVVRRRREVSFIYPSLPFTYPLHATCLSCVQFTCYHSCRHTSSMSARCSAHRARSHRSFAGSCARRASGSHLVCMLFRACKFTLIVDTC